MLHSCKGDIMFGIRYKRRTISFVTQLTSCVVFRVSLFTLLYRKKYLKHVFYSRDSFINNASTSTRTCMQYLVTGDNGDKLTTVFLQWSNYCSLDVTLIAISCMKKNLIKNQKSSNNSITHNQLTLQIPFWLLENINNVSQFSPLFGQHNSFIENSKVSKSDIYI